MKHKNAIFIVFLLSYLSVSAQLRTTYNSMRPGDEIIKQQVRYQPPGKAGANLVWDFSELTAVNPEYKLSYFLPGTVGDSLYVMGCDTLRMDDNTLRPIIGMEHYTMYYYLLRGDSLQQLGHENPNTHLHYDTPLPELNFPFDYGDVITASYDSHGLYSGLMDIRAKGTVRIHADAFGEMYLPDGDTLTVLRVKSTRLIMEPIQTADSTELFSNRILETHKWYSKGYRYPVFETIRAVHLGDSLENFTTAFYYPPQEHYYLDSDPENVAILDSLWNIKQRERDSENPMESVKLRVKAYPNPVENELTVEYELMEDAPVTIYLYTMQGRLGYTTGLKNQPSGYHTEVINCSDLPQGNYLLNMVVGTEMISRKIIKK
ncbi:T9SS C-terminal target domain-containing protein [Bacteroides sp. 214]|uniref:T9SS type A sorting domain-containing protein n=1 Tax=Bacteroides sp. 214 TaxID=2302935 RepID=UPI0013D53DE2|nr:T9SS type A sorting domain-containing protein [Bacteroides sp. 214]NDW12048.1 T9SS C-terminal target domain-containing protein [Bacteroides sp. 214]